MAKLAVLGHGVVGSGTVELFLKNRDKGIPNLMMYIGIANVAVYLLSIIDPSNVVYALLFGLLVRTLLKKRWLSGLIGMAAAAALTAAGSAS